MSSGRVLLALAWGWIGVAVACNSFSSGDGDVADAGVDAPVGDGAMSDDAGTTDRYREMILSAGPIAYWRMGVKSGSVIQDETKTGPSLVLQGTGHQLGVPGVVPGDTAIRFDGVASYAIAENSRPFDFAGGVPFTIECWARREPIDGGDDYRHLFNNASGLGAASAAGYALYEFSQDGAPPRVQMEIRVDGGGPVNTAAPAEGVWTHYAIVYADRVAKLYVNGTAFPRTTTGDFGERASAFTLGAYQKTYFFPGEIDEVAIYPRALSITEIVAHRDGATAQ